MNLDLKLSVSFSDTCVGEFEVNVFSIDDSFQANVIGTDMTASGGSLHEALLNLKNVIKPPKETPIMGRAPRAG